MDLNYLNLSFPMLCPRNCALGGAPENGFSGLVSLACTRLLVRGANLCVACFARSARLLRAANNPLSGL